MSVYMERRPAALDRSVVRTFCGDEAGDDTLFGKGGKVLVGTPGCSKYFVFGAAELAEPDDAARRLAALRERVTTCAFLAKVPSMRLTSRYFHACKDTPEVRWAVFREIAEMDVKVWVAFRRKSVLADRSLIRKRNGLDYAVRRSVLYRDLVGAVFWNLLHKTDETRLIFARRDTSIRRGALDDAVERARETYRSRRGYVIPTRVHTDIAEPSDHAGLQVIDYHLWAFQRYIERGEDRWFEPLRKNFQFVADLDDTRQSRDGETYSLDRPFTIEAAFGE